MFAPLDFSLFHTAERDNFCRALVSDLQQHGFARLVNHEVPAADIDKAFEVSRRFFNLPVHDKLKSPHPPTEHPHRGFSAFGAEKIAGASRDKPVETAPGSKEVTLLKDMKEHYDIGSERDTLYPNIWPPAGVFDEFQPTAKSFFEVCYNAQLIILEAIAIGLGIPSQTFTEMHSDQISELRLTHYPAVSRGDFKGSARIAPHTDFGSITLLFQDSVGGLQVEAPHRSGNFVDVPSGGTHECIVNVGDCLTKLTGLVSANHQVHIPEEKRNGSDDMISERYSIAYFSKPNRSAILRPLVGEVKEDRRYMTAGEFQNIRIHGTY